MKGTAIDATPAPGGWKVTAVERQSGILSLGRSRRIPFSQWSSANVPESVLAASALAELHRVSPLIEDESGGVFLSDAAAANLGSAEAAGLGFPPALPFQFDLGTTGVIGTSNYRVFYQFIRNGVRAVAERRGSLLLHGGQAFRIPNPIYAIAELADAIVETDSWDRKVELTVRLRALLPEGPTQEISASPFLFSIRMAHASAFSLDVSVSGGEVGFQPIPMGPGRDAAKLGDEEPLPLLPAVQLQAFWKSFSEGDGSNATYVLDRGTYVFLDRDLRTALTLVRDKQRGSADAKLAFLMSPARALKEAMLAESADERDIERLERLFIETAEYSDRILKVGEWQPPKIADLPGEPNNWLPERFSVVLGGKVVSGSPEDIPRWTEAVAAALVQGAASAKLGDVDVPVSDAVSRVLQRLMPPEQAPAKQPSTTAKRTARIVMAYQVKENFETDDYSRAFEQRSLEPVTDSVLRSTLRPHQTAGLNWLRSTYEVGWPGVLLADDMGLGKTIQALAFLQWLRDVGQIRLNHPVLIVAPTSLLANWQNEHDLHLREPGLGQKLVAYGASLKSIRSQAGNEADSGSEVLDISLMRRAGWVLTTYETLRDYQFSFSRVRFACVVLDEVQKAKNPRSRLTAAVKSLSSDFVIAMTGTPVENSLADLWTIADITAPGMLPPLRDFLKAYSAADPDSLAQLSRALLGPPEPSSTSGERRTVPPFALRRMKSDIAADLPKKFPERQDRMALEVEDMPRLQAEKYADVDAQAQSGQMPVLRALHDMRSISLHPIDPVALDAEMEGETYILESARMKRAFKILDDVRSRNEKALVFVNSRKIQNVVSILSERRYRCARPLIIRGDVPAMQRQAMVDDFSRQVGFAILVLSPRAAGVGLNIVAANHVIHLDRWWNPAVEDQCTDRAYRIGQTKPVWVYALAARHPLIGDRSYDLILNDILDRKRVLSRTVFMPLDIQPGEFSAAFARPTPIEEEPVDVAATIDRMTPLSFEEWIRDRAIQIGLSARLTAASWDGGADIVVRAAGGEITHLIQSKHTQAINTEIDGGMSADLERMSANWNAPEARLVGVTNAKSFTAGVRRTAAHLGALLVSRDQLGSLETLLTVG